MDEFENFYGRKTRDDELDAKQDDQNIKGLEADPKSNSFYSYSYVNADEAEVLTDAPELYNITTDVTTTSIEIQSDLISGLLTKYDVILRNNIITVDYDYNSKNYYTKKLDTSNVIIPDVGLG